MIELKLTSEADTDLRELAAEEGMLPDVAGYDYAVVSTAANDDGVWIVSPGRRARITFKLTREQWRAANAAIESIWAEK